MSRRNNRPWQVITLSVGLLLAGSCAKSAGPTTYPVTGVITRKGAPVEGALVVFLPLSEEKSVLASQDITDREGRFVMRTHQGKEQYKDGMQPGDYGVTVTKLEVVSDMSRPPRNLLPKQYSSVTTSKLRATVQPSKENDFPFVLD